MLRLIVEVATQEADAASGLLFGAGATGIQQEDHPGRTVLIVYGDDDLLCRVEAALEGAARRGLLSTHRREPVDESWQDTWVRAVETHQLTEDLFMVPRGKARPGRAHAMLRFEPGWAFGTGGHVTTRLAAQCSKECLARQPGARVLDVGTGSGTLALACLVWGAKEALGLDVDPRAIEAAEHNARLNGFSDRASFALMPLEHVEDPFDLVVANIDLPVLVALAPELARVTSPEGRLVLTGFLDEHADELLAKFHELDLFFYERTEREEWSLLLLGHAPLEKPDKVDKSRR